MYKSTDNKECVKGSALLWNTVIEFAFLFKEFADKSARASVGAVSSPMSRAAAKISLSAIPET